jgi:hypothetical protein
MLFIRAQAIDASAMQLLRALIERIGIELSEIRRSTC